MPPKKKKAKPKPRKSCPRASVKRLKWSNEAMEAAMNTVSTGAASINKAAVLHGVPPKDQETVSSLSLLQCLRNHYNSNYLFTTIGN